MATPTSPHTAFVIYILVKAGFLRSSPKVTIYPKAPKKFLGQSLSITATDNTESVSSSLQTRSGVNPSVRQPERCAPRPANATWICPICTFSNPVPSNFDPSTATSSTPIPPCLTCGIKPPLTVLLKAAIASATNRNVSDPTTLSDKTQRSTSDSTNFPTASHQLTSCPRCTFANHPSLLECEICGAPLKKASVNTIDRSDSPAPSLSTSQLENTEIKESMKLSFRGGGEKVFHERLNDALIQRKWLLYGAPPVPRSPASGVLETGPSPSGELAPRQDHDARPKGVGIAGLERRGFQSRKNNEAVIGNAFEDLEALMASAKDIVALAETLSAETGIQSNSSSSEATRVISQSAAALGMITTKDMLSGGGSDNLYLSELSRNLAEYLTDDREGILRREGGIMSLIDLWSIFNRHRNGVELVSPSDFHKAAELWGKLKLPVRLRRFQSGLLVVQPHDWTDERCIRLLETWLDELHTQSPTSEILWDWTAYGRGVTAQEAAARFGWSVGVASEELEMAEERGILCREEGIEGIRFWRNHIIGSLSAEETMSHTFTDTVSIC
ncbi:Vacuolar protein-sorting-associated protein 36 [Ophidiomyces ophidiicola]|nr:Vacuolar protein-sorting-associated protein 36 [Ophidiomyces ophidiicola]KAI1978923.1 Vacuolar protein-sorting-associated protein 36 [Ophidiomyces ophidiicola]KAI1987055.1 Vacuolar protein-sorting-associated protein 36 [Ophidiomyces ophidiicola]KAI1988134.1 Vacuolar protein-sorting-associated protein 36 [Ophidiomyces ophidiicola]KAI2087638.1 Vacuolar protein-sorting-associated protein 36 [Ophidiomyces ophidiicola]